MGIDSKTSPVLSIIVPIYNSEKFLHQCLDSIKEQTFQDWECWLIDDGSSDLSGEICDNYCKQDYRFKTIHKPNEGLVKARITGVNVSSGSYIGFVDSDDWIEPDMYEKLVDEMSDDIDIATACIIQECQGSPRLEIRGKWNRTVLDARDAIAHFLTRRVMGWEFPCKLYRKELFDESIFPIGISVGEDLVSSCYLFLKAHKVVYLPYDSYHYRLHPQSMIHNSTSDVSLKFIDAVKRVLSEYRIFSIPICNYLLYWYSYLIARELLCSYSENETNLFFSYDKLFSELKWSLSKVDCDWLNRKEKTFAKYILKTEPKNFFYEMKKRNREKCSSFAGNNEIYIYGAGKMGKALHKNLCEIGIKVKGFIVSEKNDNSKDVDGVRLYGLNELLEILPSLYIFLGVSALYLEEIKAILLKHGARHIYWPPVLKYGQLDNTGIERARDRLLSAEFLSSR